MTRAILAALLLLPLSVAGCSADSTAQEPSTSTLIYVSDYFSFVGADQVGRVAFALDNNRRRDGEAFQAEHFVVLHDERKGWMGSASAVLTWQGRTIRGRAIYEYLAMPDFNRLTRTYFSLWEEFQGLYLLVDGKDDVYLHSQLSERLAPLVGNLIGFAVLNEE